MLENVGAGIEQYMNLVSARQKLVASNIANADTPGYQTKDIDFESELQNQMSGSKPNVIEVSGLKNKNDGNNVDMDREARLLAENALRFSVASQPGARARSAPSAPPSKREARAREPLFQLSSQRVGNGGAAPRTEVLVENLANSETTRTPEGGPYRRKDVVFTEDNSIGSFSSQWMRRSGRLVSGVAVSEIAIDNSAPRDALPARASGRRQRRIRRVSESQSGRRHGGLAGRLARL